MTSLELASDHPLSKKIAKGAAELKKPSFELADGCKSFRVTPGGAVEVKTDVCYGGSRGWTFVIGGAGLGDDGDVRF